MKKIRLRSNKLRRILRVRGKISGTKERPRLCVFRSNKYTYGQLVDDKTAKTLVDVSDKVREVHIGKNKTQAAFELGKLLAKRAKVAKITNVVFDKRWYKYHGRVKSFADGARSLKLVF